MATVQKHLYINQPYVAELDTRTTLDTATAMYIRYKTPEGTIGLLEAVESSPGVLQATVPGSVNSVSGQWELRAWVTFSSDPNPVPGTPVKIIVEEID